LPDVFLAKPVKAAECAGIIPVEIQKPELGRDAVGDDGTETGMLEQYAFEAGCPARAQLPAGDRWRIGQYPLIWIITLKYPLEIGDQRFQHPDFEFELFAIVFSVFDCNCHAVFLMNEENEGSFGRATTRPGIGVS
jgi:hypothetical protein